MAWIRSQQHRRRAPQAKQGARRVQRLSRPRQLFSLLSSTGWNSAVAFFSSVAGSAPLIMLVSATPNTSRNSVTGAMIGSPGCAMLAEVSMHSTHSLGALKSLDFCAAAYAELRTGAPAAACSMRVWLFLFDAHWM